MEHEINQHEDKFLQALRNTDIKACAELIHDKLLYNNPMGQLLTKEMDIEDFASSNPSIEKLDCLDRKMEVFDDTAVVSTVLHLKGIFMGNRIEGNSRFLRTWKKFGDGWKIIGAASINLK